MRITSEALKLEFRKYKRDSNRIIKTPCKCCWCLLLLTKEGKDYIKQYPDIIKIFDDDELKCE